jgi:rubrerythrin
MKYNRIVIWCDECDTHLIEPGKKCPKCGHKKGDPKRFKK